MRVDDARALGDSELEHELEKAREELFNLRFQLRMGRLPDTNRVMEARRGVARLLTVRRERQLWAQYEAAKEAVTKE